ncbi:protein yippee-like At3g55890 [Camellia sinensis]|uniref:protein yippee-like At3g55890 n=1 Tax=Camellia sinensis TaxID=4442 RepID=UPI001035F3F0|nr:protein yippee-like At3g55890 [Camellia sinensis]
MWDGREMLYPDTLMVTFNQTTAAHFFLCCQCSTLLVLVKDLMHLIPDIMINAGIFQNVVNVDVAGEAHYRAEDANVVTDVNCKGCRKLLGWKFVFVPVQTKEVQTGRFLLHLKKLLRWDINDEPVENA